MPKKRVLIADDDRALVDILTRHARSMDLDVDVAFDSLTALWKATSNHPDVAILDVEMPAGNGLGVREMMSGNEKLASVPVIILTGRTDERTIRRCHESCAYYIPKCPDVWLRIEPLLVELLSNE